MGYESFPILVARAPAASPTAFTTLGELDTVSLPELTSNDADASVQNSTIDAYVISTLIRRSETPLRLNALPYDSGQNLSAGLLGAYVNKTFDGYQFSHAASSLIWVASGYIKAFKMVTPMEGKMSVDVTMRFSGKMTINGVTVGT